MGQQSVYTPNDQGIELDSKAAAKLRRSPEEYAVIYDGKEYSSFSSSNVQLFYYDYEEAHLYVQFKDNSLYRYDGVPEQVVVQFMRAGSKGRFVWYGLRGHYAYHKIY